MFKEFKETMDREFEMTDIRLRAFFLGIEVKQVYDGNFISQMENCKPINILMDCGINLSKNDSGY